MFLWSENHRLMIFLISVFFKITFLDRNPQVRLSITFIDLHT